MQAYNDVKPLPVKEIREGSYVHQNNVYVKVVTEEITFSMGIPVTDTIRLGIV